MAGACMEHKLHGGRAGSTWAARAPCRSPGESWRPVVVAADCMRGGWCWIDLEVRDNRKIIYGCSGLAKVNLTFKVLATRSTVLFRGALG